VLSEPDLAATIAGAITIPINARAIKRSCIAEVLLTGQLATCPHMNHRLD
jgi:hypothetical protein